MKAATVHSADKAIYVRISIHAAREGGDSTPLDQRADELISIHAAREGGDIDFSTSAILLSSFQSTPPVKAATLFVERPVCCCVISIHAAREGGDLGSTRLRTSLCRFQSTPPVKAATLTAKGQTMNQKFQSTPPVKAATSSGVNGADAGGISIHAAREGGDCMLQLIE